jgi:hypothetical protein
MRWRPPGSHEAGFRCRKRREQGRGSDGGRPDPDAEIGTQWYLVQWAGHNYANTSWEPAENLEGAREAVADFHRDHPAKPRA